MQSRSLSKALTDGAINFGLLIISALMFSLAFPNFLSYWGFFPFGFICLIPVFIVVHRSSWITIPIYGLIYGFTAYAIFNYWLVNFHPLSIFIVPVIYAVYFMMLFPLLKGADAIFPKYGYLLQIGLWIGYEYLRTRGFLGYPYGIIGYSQYLFVPLVRLSAVTGIWGVSLLVIFPSAFLGNALKNGIFSVKTFFLKHKWEPLIYAGVFILTLAYGIISKSNYQGADTLKVALVQQNVDPKIGGLRAYRRSLDILKKHSNAALKDNPDMIIWSETSFVPGITFHTKYREDQERYLLVKELTDFLSAQDIPFVFGNGDGELIRTARGLVRQDYNSAILYDKEFVDSYYKTRLVPFTEHFPYRKQFPWLYNALVEADTSFWAAGDEFTVFEAAGVKFSTPICFEDTFGYISRTFVNEGAELIINLTNDSWSESVAAAMQHMAMAVFRAAENRVSVVRSTNGGISCIIDPNGKIIEIYPAFVEGYMIGEVPVYTGRKTVYRVLGNWFPVGVLWTTVAVFITGMVLYIIRKLRGQNT